MSAIDDHASGIHWVRFDIEGLVDVVAEVDFNNDGKVLSFKAKLQDDPSNLLDWLGDALAEGWFEYIDPPDHTTREVPFVASKSSQEEP